MEFNADLSGLAVDLDLGYRGVIRAAAQRRGDSSPAGNTGCDVGLGPGRGGSAISLPWRPPEERRSCAGLSSCAAAIRLGLRRLPRQLVEERLTGERQLQLHRRTNPGRDQADAVVFTRFISP